MTCYHDGRTKPLVGGIGWTELKGLIIIIAVMAVLAAIVVCWVVMGGVPRDGGKSAPSDEAAEITYEDYNGKKIGILTGTNMEAESFKYFPDSEYFYFDGYPTHERGLDNGKIDAYLRR